MYQNISINSIIMHSSSLFLFQVVGIVKTCCHVKATKDFLHRQGSFLTTHSSPNISPSILSMDFMVLWPQFCSWIAYAQNPGLSGDGESFSYNPDPLLVVPIMQSNVLLYQLLRVRLKSFDQLPDSCYLSWQLYPLSLTCINRSRPDPLPV